MKAFLVDVSFTTRVVVPDLAAEEFIIKAAQQNMKSRLQADMHGEIENNISEIQPDLEMPFEKERDKPGLFGVYG
jgi:hypothetical protein